MSLQCFENKKCHQLRGGILTRTATQNVIMTSPLPETSYRGNEKTKISVVYNLFNVKCQITKKTNVKLKNPFTLELIMTLCVLCALSTDATIKNINKDLYRF